MKPGAPARRICGAPDAPARGFQSLADANGGERLAMCGFAQNGARMNGTIRVINCIAHAAVIFVWRPIVNRYALSSRLEAKRALEKAKMVHRDAQRYRALRDGRVDLMVVTGDGSSQVWGPQLDAAIDRELDGDA
jgi:hypothetical protein